MVSITASAPQFLVEKLNHSQMSYEQRLGFSCNFVYGDFYAGVSRDRAVIHLKCAHKLEAERAHRRSGEHLDASLAVSGVGELHEELVGRGAPIIKPLEPRPWGARDFYVEDPDGYILCFSEANSQRLRRMNFDTNIKQAVYRHFASTGAAPAPDQLSAHFACSVEDVHAALVRLQRNRVLLLEANSETIRMAPPFSAVPTPHRVEVGRQLYFANCAWDALGIPAALHREAVVHSKCGESGAPLHLQVGLDGPEPSRWLFHCQVPAARWWFDLVFT